MTSPQLTVIIPTYNEQEPIVDTIVRIERVLSDANIDFEILFIDDESTDATIQEIQSQQHVYSNIRYIVRSPPEIKDAARAIVFGFDHALAPIVCVTDADGSHEIEKIPVMYREVHDNGYDISMGSRYMSGGGTVNWPLLRRVLSRGATFISRLVFPYITDPGNFFAMKLSVIDGVTLRASGFKLSIEIIDKGKWESVSQIPYTFTERSKGKSKLKPEIITRFLNEMLDIIVYAVKHRNTRAWDEISSSIKFTIIGALGIFVNLSLLYILTDIVGIFYMLSGILAIFMSLTINFILNDTFSFKKKSSSIPIRFVKYVSITSIGVIINLATLYILTQYMGIFYVLSSFIGILVAYAWNLMINRRVTWRKNF